MVSIRGLQKITLVDYPGRVACTVFLPGCDFRCPFCHNPALINDVDSLPEMPEEEFFNFLKSREKWLDGVCVTGGEPCLSPDLPGFLKKIKEGGFLVKLDTNGSLPDCIKLLVDKKLVDFVAMDIKASPERYSEAAGVRVNISRIQESINLIRSSGLPYEFRTTVIPRLHSKDELLEIGEWLEGSSTYVLQQFRGDFGTLDPSWADEESYPRDKFKEFKKLLNPYFKKVVLRVE
ncbi:anaerobic ribonucleoside-triphosphate reductase activating protein [archaeon]|nr:anaerobic ribonucleoside-triphosphate reductase activating protein [archaeon]